MMNIIEVELQKIRAAAADQSNRIRSEINGAVDLMTAAKVNFVSEMDRAAKLRSEAEQIEIDAKMTFNTQISNMLAQLLSVEKQIGDGEIITGVPVIENRPKPKLIGGKD